MQQFLEPGRQIVRPRRGEQGVALESLHVELRRDLVRVTRDQRILAPLRALCDRMQRSARLAPLADTLERFVLAVFEQRVKDRRERRIVEQIAAEDLQQARLGHERRKREEHEMTLRTLAAPAIGRPRTEDAKVAVAARKRIVILCRFRERTRDRKLGPGPQQREVVEILRDVRLWILAQQAFEIDTLTPLMIDFLTTVFERCAPRP